MKKHKLGLVLGGGGVRGVAHVALLELLEELGLQPDIISGSSAGALVGALYASGMRGKDIVSFFSNAQLFKMAWVTPSKAGIFDSDRYTSFFEKHLPGKFNELEIPIVVTAVNMFDGKPEYFDSGDLYYPLLASCAVPLIFSPVEINGTYYCDGGVMDNYPIDPLVQNTEHIVGSYVSSPGTRESQDLNSSLKVINHANSLLLHAANQYKFAMSIFNKEFDLGQYGIFDTKKIDKIYNKAIEEVERDRDKLQNIASRILNQGEVSG